MAPQQQEKPDRPRIVFAGTPEFAARSLEALLEAGHRVEAVLSQPDRPAGRGRHLQPSPVTRLARERELAVLQPEKLRGADIRRQLEALEPDVMVVAAYGLLVPPKVLAIPRYGCINVHGSLLPRWRGAAPIQRAIAAGDTETGVTIMQMEKGLDTGPMLHSLTTPIHDDDTGGSLHDRLAELGARALLTVLEDLPGYLAAARPQPAEGVTYANKLERRDGRIEWWRPAPELAHQVRAFNPWPVAWTECRNETLRIQEAAPVAGEGTPGEVLRASDEGIDVAAGEGALRLLRVQRPGKRAMTVGDLLHGRPDFIQPGERLGGT